MMVGKRLSAAAAGWIFLVSYTAGVIFSASFSSRNVDGEYSLGLFLIQVLIGNVLFFLLPGVIWTRSRGVSLKQTLRLHTVPWSVVGLGLLLYAVSQVPMLFLHQLTEAALTLFGDAYKPSDYPIADNVGTLLLLLLCIGIIPPLCEELLFRGVLLSGFEQRGALFGIVMSSAMFALFHDNPYRLIELFASALVSALIVQRSGSILPGLAIHMATNLTYVLGSYARGGDLVQGVSSGGSVNVPMLLLVGVASLPAIYVCWLILKRMEGMMARSREQSGSGTARTDEARGRIEWLNGSREDAAAGKSRLAARWGWLVPITLAVIVFIVKAVVG
ncbi:CPBP family intramembrane metalloprotease [Paenibacillus sp. PR3]|uniref:CPBP family intramembrane metalloprotease n=1 Tax=Paenibacillus terricola TaxID=2763503 RepID=A0ABR8N3Y5_9BACL|nr:type II CAAX endopeptidase family protein [Paenibacillus terricola]MBD3921539.1 CPBP family intramembrane metalloprotease [Paenibacillus terricola]